MHLATSLLHMLRYRPASFVFEDINVAIYEHQLTLVFGNIQTTKEMITFKTLISPTSMIVARILSATAWHFLCLEIAFSVNTSIALRSFSVQIVQQKELFSYQTLILFTYFIVAYIQLQNDTACVWERQFQCMCAWHYLTFPYNS